MHKNPFGHIKEAVAQLSALLDKLDAERASEDDSNHRPFGAQGHAANEVVTNTRRAGEGWNNKLSELANERDYWRNKYTNAQAGLDGNGHPTDAQQARDDESFTRGYNMGLRDKQEEHDQELESFGEMHKQNLKAQQALIDQLVSERGKYMAEANEARAALSDYKAREELGRQELRKEISRLAAQLVESAHAVDNLKQQNQALADNNGDITLTKILREQRVIVWFNHQFFNDPKEHSRAMTFTPLRIVRDYLPSSIVTLKLVGINEESGRSHSFEATEIDSWESNT